MKLVTLCADDFALSLAGSRRILQLIDGARLSATCVMSQSSYWPELAPELSARSAQADIGLHFNLTEPFNQQARPLPYWLLRSHLRWLDKGWLKQCLLEQIDRFTEHFQQLPDFVDGHQHVHAFPIIRQALFEAISERWQGQDKPYLRGPDLLGEMGDTRFKASVLTASCRGFSSQAREQGFHLPSWFAGLYSLKPTADFNGLMQRWLAGAPAQGLIMCHPGVDESGDAIGPARELEYRYLASDDFAEDFLTRQVMLGRFVADDLKTSATP